MDEHVGSSGETSHALARGGVTADRHRELAVAHEVANGGRDRMVIDEGGIHCPGSTRVDGGDSVRRVERPDFDDGPRSGRRRCLRVERLVVVRVETRLGVPCRRPLGCDHRQRRGCPTDPPSNGQRCQIADVVGVVMGDEHRIETSELEPGLQDPVRRGPATVDQHPALAVADGHRRAGACRVRVRRAGTEQNDRHHRPSLRVSFRRHSTRTAERRGPVATVADQAIETEDRRELPRGDGERYAGYAIMGLPFRSGHVLAMRRSPASSIGPAYTSIWHRRQPCVPRW